jgi:hypothetical protein
MKRQSDVFRCYCSTTVESGPKTPPPYSNQGAAKLVESRKADKSKGQRSRQLQQMETVIVSLSAADDTERAEDVPKATSEDSVPC